MKRWQKWVLSGLTLLFLVVVGIIGVNWARSELERGIMGSLGSSASH